jgi:hypothetical protein
VVTPCDALWALAGDHVTFHDIAERTLRALCASHLLLNER